MERILCHIEDVNGGYFCYVDEIDYFLNEKFKGCGGKVCDIGSKEKFEKEFGPITNIFEKEVCECSVHSQLGIKRRKRRKKVIIMYNYSIYSHEENIVLQHETKFTKKEFSKMCKEAPKMKCGSRSFFICNDIEDHLIKNHGFKEIEYAAKFYTE